MDVSVKRQVWEQIVDLQITAMGCSLTPCFLVLNLARDFFPLPRGMCFLICSVFPPLHLSCHFPSMLRAICSILELEPFILRVICSILELNLPCCMLFAALWRWNFIYFACYLPHLGAGTFYLSCCLPHLRAGTFQFACYL